MTNHDSDAMAGDGLLNDAAGRALAHDLERLFATPVPDLRFTPGTVPDLVPPASSMPRSKQTKRIALAGVAAAAAVAALLLLSGIFGGGATEVNAQTVLQRAEAAAAHSYSGPSYHIVATWAVVGDGAKESRTRVEAWADGDGRLRTQSSMGLESAWEFGYVVNGADTWVYQASGGVTRAAHAPSSAVYGFQPEQVRGSSLAETLASYSDSGCRVAQAAGSATVAGRDAYVIRVVPNPDGCADWAEGEKLRGSDLGILTAWVDKETFLTLKTEQSDASGKVSLRYEVEQIDVGGDLPDDVFTYTPPAGVTVTEATDQSSMKTAISGLDAPGAEKEAPEPDVVVDGEKK